MHSTSQYMLAVPTLEWLDEQQQYFFRACLTVSASKKGIVFARLWASLSDLPVNETNAPILLWAAPGTSCTIARALGIARAHGT